MKRSTDLIKSKPGLVAFLTKCATKDYEMDLFDIPRRIKKVPSPLKHLLKDDMKRLWTAPYASMGSSECSSDCGWNSQIAA